MRGLFVALLLSFPALAADDMQLYPKGRDAYQEKFDAKTEQYEVSKRSYIDNLYEYKGEGGATEAGPMPPESALDTVLNDAGAATGDKPASALPPQPGAPATSAP